MASAADVRDGLTILLKYDRGDGESVFTRRGGFLAVERDLLLAGVAGEGGAVPEVLDGDREELKRLGWAWSEKLQCWEKQT